MKKLLVAILALSTVTAFAHDGEHKHMVRFSGFDNAGFSDTFDVSFGTTTNQNGTDKNDKATNNVAINYAYALSNSWQVGATYKNKHTAGSGDVTTTGLSGYFNLDGQLTDTCYVALHYDMTTDKTGAKDVKTNTITAEYGHRFALGQWMGFHLNFAPSLAYSTATTDYDQSALKDQTKNALAWNWIKFDVLF